MPINKKIEVEVVSAAAHEIDPNSKLIIFISPEHVPLLTNLDKQLHSLLGHSDFLLVPIDPIDARVYQVPPKATRRRVIKYTHMHYQENSVFPGYYALIFRDETGKSHEEMLLDPDGPAPSERTEFEIGNRLYQKV